MKLIKYVNSLDRGSCHGLSPCLKSNPAAAAAIAPALISGGANVLGNLLGFASQKSANDTNLEIAKYNAAAQKQQNEANYWYTQQLMQQQNDFNYKQYLENRNYMEQYNNPKNVRARLEAAGINPLYAMGNGSGQMQNVSAIQSANPSFNGVASQLNYQKQPFMPDFTGVGNAANAYFQNELLNKQVEGVSYDNQLKAVELRYKAWHEYSDLLQKRANIENTLQSTKVGSAQYDKLVSEKNQLDNQIRLFNDTFNDLKEREKLQNDIMKEQKQNLISDRALKRSQTWLNQLNAEWFPQMQKAQIDLITEQQMQVVQNTALMVEEKRLTNKKAIEQEIINGIKGLEYQDEEIKHGIRHGNNQATKTLYYFADYVSSLLLGNMKLFGK